MKIVYTFILSLAALFAGTAALGQQVPIPGKTIPKYVEPIPTFAGNRVDGTHDLTITAKEVRQQVLPAANAALGVAGYPQTTVWGYEIYDGENTYPAHYPSFTVEARKGVATHVTYLNDLGNQTLYTPVGGSPGILPVDQTLHWADPLGDHTNGHGPMTPYGGPVPIVTHLHGGEVSSKYDGGPDAWFTPDFAQKGPAWYLAPPDAVSNVYEYPNTQEAATIWFHDHALGVTRLNVYAGLAAFYLLRDGDDTGLPDNPIGLPAGDYEHEVVIQDRMFDANGQLFFPSVAPNPGIHPYWVPEFMGDVIVVNGKTWPYMEVEPRRYRFRFLDGSNARFYQMFLMDLARKTPGPVFWQIGTDGGLLDVPVKIDPNDPILPKKLLMAPGERADVIIDFAGFAGQTLTIRNNAKAPFPNGVAADPQTVGQIMQFRVVRPLSGPDNSYDPATGGPLRAPLVKLTNFANATPLVTPSVTRQLTLNEIMGLGGPLEVLVNNTKWMADVTENPTEGATEVWQIVNMTADAHPMHLHLTQFQLVSRQKFNSRNYTKVYDAAFPGGLNPADGVQYPAGTFMPGFGPPLPYGSGAKVGGSPDVTPFLQGPKRPPEPNEWGWKDTYIMYPGEVTTVIVRWAPTELPTTTAAADLIFPAFNPAEGPGYVWHCHIIDHEDNEMMRPYSVAANPARVFAGSTAMVRSASEVGPSFRLEQNYPNPFNPTTHIVYSVPVDGHVTLKVYSTLGQEVATIIDNPEPAGEKTVGFDASSLPTGLYFLRLTSAAQTATKTMMLVK
jgi:spore coat protein A